MIKISIYLLSSAFLILISATIWSYFLADKLYYCSDRVPILDFIPPFVHDLTHNVPDKGRFIGKNDYYIASPIVVFGVWLFLIVSSIVGPFLIMRLVVKKQILTKR